MDILEKLKFAQQVHLDASQEIEKMCDRMVDIACSSDFNDLDTSCLGLPEWGSAWIVGGLTTHTYTLGGFILIRMTTLVTGLRTGIVHLIGGQ